MEHALCYSVVSHLRLVSLVRFHKGWVWSSCKRTFMRYTYLVHCVNHPLSFVGNPRFCYSFEFVTGNLCLLKSWFWVGPCRSTQLVPLVFLRLLVVPPPGIKKIVPSRSCQKKIVAGKTLSLHCLVWRQFLGKMNSFSLFPNWTMIIRWDVSNSQSQQQCCHGARTSQQAGCFERCENERKTKQQVKSPNVSATAAAAVRTIWI